MTTISQPANAASPIGVETAPAILKFELPDIDRTISFEFESRDSADLGLARLLESRPELAGRIRVVTAPLAATEAPAIAEGAAPHRLDRAACRAYIERVCGHERDAVIFLRSPADRALNKSFHGWCENLDQIEALHNGKGWGLYVMHHRMDGTGRRESQNVIGTRVIPLDWDHGRPHLPLHPTWSNETRQGRLQEFYLLSEEITPAMFEHIMAQLVRRYPGEGDSKRNQLDPACQSIAQPFRVVGSVNTKDGGRHRVEMIDEANTASYSLAEFMAAFEIPPVPSTAVNGAAGDCAVAEKASRQSSHSSTAPPSRRRERPSTAQRSDGERGRLTMGAPYISFADEPDWAYGAHCLKIASRGDEWGFQLFHTISMQSPRYVGEADCRAKWKSAKSTGMTPNAAAGRIMKRVKATVSGDIWKEINRTHPHSDGERREYATWLSINPEGWYEAPAASYGSAMWARDLELSDRAVLKALRAHYRLGENRDVPATLASLAAYSGVDSRTVARALKRLEANAVIVEHAPQVGAAPGRYELCERGTDWNDVRKSYMTAPKLCWAALPRVDGDHTIPLPKLSPFFKVFNARYLNAAWPATNPAGQEIIDLMAAMDFPSKTGVHMMAKRFLHANIGLSQDAIASGISAAMATGLVVRHRKGRSGINRVNARFVSGLYSSAEYGITDDAMVKNRKPSRAFWQSHKLPTANGNDALGKGLDDADRAA